MNGLARTLHAEGYAAWNIEYRRVGVMGGGGGWPETFEDVAAAIDHLTDESGIDLDHVVTCGHSAGGHLALWAASRNRLADTKVRVRAAVSLAGILDLDEADRLRLGGDAAARFLGGHCDEIPSVYAQASPARLLPLGVPQILVHGSNDEVIPPSMTDEYEVRAREAGDPVTRLKMDGVDHRDLIDSAGPSWAATFEAIRALD
jgi:acetyl esterase/lipase